ncbi:hypothetical protein TrispH2_009887 [Trichoplax sp. H2]|nr:hypothetical protein TrispH2_009887 [Trichoplax sp. H2]|eukprot:RDD38255.1 hypothetical protein TrispH2_009887 [Trichoplax sp. H2]
MDLDDQWLVSQYECFEKEIADLWQLSQDELKDHILKIAQSYLRPEISNALYAKAIKNCQQRIEIAASTNQPNPHAHFQLGYYYQLGCGNLKIDLNKAKYHYEQAILHDHYAAMYQICSLYGELEHEENGHHDTNPTTQQQYVEMIDRNKLISMKLKMYIRAAAYGLHEKAIRDLRHYYLQYREWIRAIDQLKAEYEEQIETAIDKNINIAEVYNNLGFLECFLEWCQVVEGDEGDEPLVDFPQQAYDYFLKAGELGLASGYMNFAFYRGYDANCVDQETNGIKNNFMIMAKYYLKAAQNGCAISWQKLYDVLKTEFKSCVPKRNLLKYVRNALKHYRFSDMLLAMANNFMTQNSIEMASFSHAIQYLEEAVVSCHSYSTDDLRNEFLYLGFMYEQGLGVERDTIKAAHFYAWSITTQCECTLAVCRLAKLIEKNHLPPPHDITHAIKLYESTMLLIKQDVTSYAQYRLGNLFHSGRYENLGILPDMAEYHYDGTSNAMISLILSGKATAAHIYHLAKMHAVGCMVDPAIEKAIDLYSNALAYYKNADYHDRFHAIKAKLQLQKIKNRHQLNYKERNNQLHIKEINSNGQFSSSELFMNPLDQAYYDKEADQLQNKFVNAPSSSKLSINSIDKSYYSEQINLLHSELDSLQLPSPSKLLMNCINIAEQYLSQNVELSYRQPIYNKIMAELNDQPTASTFYHIGNLYFRGQGFQQFDLPLAMEYLKKAADMNHPLAKLDMLYLYGCQEKGDDPSLSYKITDTAEELAKIELTVILDTAYQGDRRALTYLQKRLELFHAWNIAVDNLIKHHKNELTSQVKNLKSTDLARLCLELGFLIMAKNLEKDHLNEKIITEIETYFQKAENLDNSRVDFFMGLLCEFTAYSHPNAQNDEHCAIKYYERALKAGNNHLSPTIATYYLHGQCNNDHLLNQSALDLLQQSHHNGFADATSQLSMIYLDGRCDTQQDFQRFTQLAEIALATTYSNDIDNTFLYYHLAFYYYHYSHVNNRYERAAHFCALDMSQQLDDGRTRCLMAKMLEKRRLSSSSLTDAIKMYLSALYLDDNLTGYIHYRLGKLRSNLSEIDVYDLKLAQQHFHQAQHYMRTTKTSNIVTKCRDMYHLGLMFEHGFGVAQCIEKAKEWYKRCYQFQNNCHTIFGCHQIKYYITKSKKRLNILEADIED